jgi:hypothetical protein
MASTMSKPNLRAVIGPNCAGHGSTAAGGTTTCTHWRSRCRWARVSCS